MELMKGSVDEIKGPKFDKYKGVACPKANRKTYVRKMVSHTRDDKLLIHYFHDSLSGGIARRAHTIGAKSYSILERLS